jgi:integrase/recombinase XerD
MAQGIPHTRKLITTEQLKALVDTVIVPRDKAVILLLAKTGRGRGELVTIDLNDIDLVLNKITPKPKAKRSNRVVFFDEECGRVLQDWLSVRSRYAAKDSPALFVTSGGGRLDKNGGYNIVTSHARLVGQYSPDSDRLEDRFTPHCLRRWFTTYLRSNGMPREMVQELRGDVRLETIDIYLHIDEEELRRAYLAAIPKLGID